MISGITALIQVTVTLRERQGCGEGEAERVVSIHLSLTSFMGNFNL